MWVNLNEENASNILHHHPHSTLSGVYYVDVPPHSQTRGGNISFADPRVLVQCAGRGRKPPAELFMLCAWCADGHCSEQHWRHLSRAQGAHARLQMQREISILPSPGLLLLWPSWLPHRVHPFVALPRRGGDSGRAAVCGRW